ncbi:MAG: hypothetical protein KME17_01740 [Cyanosarcina radialis HA8281-LM2]|nr:hypothetical protein [Cyanosarcina radialis HA8281-LM2]
MGASYAAIFTLRLQPKGDTNEVMFENLVEDDISKEWYEPYIKRGVREFIADRAKENIKIGGIKVSLIEHCFHPIDSQTSACTRAAKIAMGQALEKVNC